jgi:hypothetical protein
MVLLDVRDLGGEFFQPLGRKLGFAQHALIFGAPQVGRCRFRNAVLAMGKACGKQQHRGGKDAATQKLRFPSHRNRHNSRHMPPGFYRLVR